MASDIFLEYNCIDACVTLEAHNKFWHELEQGYNPAYDLTMAIFEPLLFMQTRGIRVDRSLMEETKRDIQVAAKTKQGELNELCGRALNVNSPKDCQAYFYIEKGIPPYHSDEGRITVDDLALQRLARGTSTRRGLREAKLVQDIRSLNKLHGTYLEISFDADERIRCSYNPRGTKFGRLSSSTTIFGTGTNLQNLPQEFKKFLVADEGYIFWEVDKRQAEWVVVAYLANDASMIKAIEQELDVHVYTAQMMFGLPPEVIALESMLVGMNTDAEIIAKLRSTEPLIEKFAARMPRSMSCRQCGKKANHGLNYDEGFNKFALINELDTAEAKRIIDLYHRGYPGIRQTYHETVKRQLQQTRTLTSCFGRKVRFLDAWGPDLWKAGYAMLPQSTVVDSLNKGMVEVYRNDFLAGAPGGIDLLAQTHDSILLQVPLDWFSNEGAFEGAREMVYNAVSPELEYNGRRFKIATDSKLGLNWGGFHKDTNPKGMQDLEKLYETWPTRSLPEAVGVTRSQ